MHLSANSPVAVVFLHGLLGSKEDWAAVFQILQKFPQIRPLALDLPCHGSNQTVECGHLLDARKWLQHTLRTAFADTPFFLVGYSLGGRLALDYALNSHDPHLLGTLLEGTNIGLSTEAERCERSKNDHRWAMRFRTEPLERVLQAWYAQPVFADLSADKRLEFIKKRQNNCGERIATMLEATSLAKQPNFLSQITALSAESGEEKIAFVVGERDEKFRQIMQQNKLPHRVIANAGHNAHHSEPEAFVQQLIDWIGIEYGSSPLP